MELEEKHPLSCGIPAGSKMRKPLNPVDWELDKIEIELGSTKKRASRWEGTAPWQKAINKQADCSSPALSSAFPDISRKDHESGSQDLPGQAEEISPVSLVEGATELKFHEQSSTDWGPIGTPRNRQNISKSKSLTAVSDAKNTVHWHTPSLRRHVSDTMGILSSGASDDPPTSNPGTFPSISKSERRIGQLTLSQNSDVGGNLSSGRSSSASSNTTGTDSPNRVGEPSSKAYDWKDAESSTWASGNLVRKVSGARAVHKATVVFSSYANVVKADMTDADIPEADMRRVSPSAPEDEIREILVGSFKRITLKQDTGHSTNGDGEHHERQNEAESDISKHNLSVLSKLKNFLPTAMCQENAGLIKRPAVHRYLGSPVSAAAALQIEDLPSEQNCALWITHIGLEVAFSSFFRAIRTGAVFALHFSPAEPQGEHRTKAAKLVFMKHKSAAEFLNKVNSFAGVTICGVRINAIWNRNGYVENTSKKSRVIHIIGPKDLMTFENWTSYFRKYVCFDLETRRNLPEGNRHRKKMEFRFARIDGQAEAIYQAISRDTELDSVEVEYAPDPCDSEPTIG